VCLSDDFVPSQAFYSAYLMDCETYSFLPSHESLRCYESYSSFSAPGNFPPKIGEIEQQDLPLLFVEASVSKWHDDPHPLPRRF